MSQKLINTRIGLKYDTYANWTKVVDGVAFDTTFIPLKGEVIFYEIPTGSSASDPNPNTVTNVTPPAILFKVGDGENFLHDLAWGSAIAADVYDWAKQQSLLGGEYNSQTGTWGWSSASGYDFEQREVSAYIKKETANIKIRIVPTTPPAGHDGEDGWYDTEVSTDNGTSWTASNTPFKIDIEAYTAGAGLQLNGTEFSIDTDGTYLSATSANGLDIVPSNVEFTSESGYDLTATTGVLTDQAIGEIKDYVDAKAQEVNTVISVIEKSTPNTGYLKTYQVTQDGTVKGEIDIPKDFLVKSATSSIVTAADKEQGGKFYEDDNYQVGDPYLDFVINVKEGTATDEHVYVNVKNLVDTYSAGEGLVLNGTEFSINKYVGDIADATSGTGTDYFADAKQIKDFVDSEATAAITAANQYTDEAIAEKIPTHTAGDGIDITTTSSDGIDVNIAVKLGTTPALGFDSGDGLEVVLDETTQTSQLTQSSGLQKTAYGLRIDDTVTWVLQCGGASTEE